MKFYLQIVLVIFFLTSCKTNKMENTLIVKDSPYNLETTYNKLKNIIDDNPNLKIILELDHSKNAASVDLELNPTKIIMFGNPKLGTPLMQASPTVGIDLPQKIIIYSTKEGETKLAYNNPAYLKERHNIDGKDDMLNKITGALNTITNKAIE